MYGCTKKKPTTREKQYKQEKKTRKEKEIVSIEWVEYKYKIVE